MNMSMRLSGGDFIQPASIRPALEHDMHTYSADDGMQGPTIMVQVQVPLVSMLRSSNGVLQRSPATVAAGDGTPGRANVARMVIPEFVMST